MNHSQQLELSLGKRTELILLICTPNIIKKNLFYEFENQFYDASMRGHPSESESLFTITSFL